MCTALQAWAAKVVQGDLGSRPDVALAARAMYIVEVNQTKPLWAAWRANDTQFVRYTPWPSAPSDQTQQWMQRSGR